jgi:signal transduction histidine kinase
MNAFSSLILTQLTVPPGDLIYYIVLVFAVASALQSAFNQWRISEFPQARRAFIGLGVLLLAQVTMFLFSGLGWQHLIEPSTILPPMDRAFIAFGVVCIIWLYAFPEPNRSADVVSILLGILVVIALGLSYTLWKNQVGDYSYNYTNGDLFWQVSSALLILAGIGILFVRKPDGMWNGVILLAIGLLGHAGHLLIRVEGNYSGVVRLAYMVAYPILLTLPQRFASAPAPARASQPARSAAKSEASESGGAKRYSADPKTFQALLALAAETNPTKVSQAITRAIAQTMLSDLCFLLYLTDNNNQMVIAGGYDLIREDNLQGGSLNKNNIPMLANSLQRGRPLRMPASSTSADIKGLGDILGLTTPGHLLSVPIVTPDKETLGGVLLLSPYSDRTWTAEDQAFLTNVSSSLVPIIQRSQKMSKMESDHERTLNQMSDLERRVFDLNKQLDAARAENEKAASAELASLRVAQEDSQRIIEQLQQENVELRSTKAQTYAAPAVSTTQVEKELKAALQEMARLQNQLAEASMRAHQYEKIQTNSKVADQAEVIMSISQELRQPLSSIIGYTDLLLGETVGILGALQRKFVERIKVSTERLNSLLDDMIYVTNLEADRNELKHEPLDLNTLIDNAMSYTSPQVREKNISIHLDLPKKVSPIYADRDALQQVLIHLAQNASAATPYEGTIKIKAETRVEGQVEYILIQVTDTGVGIPADELPHVFTRLYHSEAKPVQGVGDTGVGLSIAKTLIEAHHGRIWVESQVGVGSTFSILLPMSGTAEKKQKGKGNG